MKPLEVALDVIFSELSEEDNLSLFDCGHDDTNEFLKEDSFKYRDKDLAITYVLKNKSDEVFGFASLVMGVIRLTQDDVEIKQQPGLKIGRMGIDKRKQGEKYGSLLIHLSMAIALSLKPFVGCRFLLVDSYPDNMVFYGKNGFKGLYSKIGNRDTMSMYLRLKEKY